MNIDRKKIVTGILCMATMFAAQVPAYGQGRAPLFSISDQRIYAEFNRSGINVLTSPQDTFKANFLPARGVLGRVRVNYQARPDGDWIAQYTADSVSFTSAGKIAYTDYKTGIPLKVERIFEKKGQGIDWTIRLESMMSFPVKIGSLAIPINWNKPGGEDPDHIFEQCFTKHQYIGGNSSYLYFTRASGQGPYLLMMAKPGTRLEYYESGEQFQVFIHAAQPEQSEKKGTWRLQTTTLQLAAAGKPGSSKEYGFHVRWVNSYDEMRQALYEQGLLDVRVVPGMTIPTDLQAAFSLHSKNRIDSIVPEFPGQTEIQITSSPKEGQKIVKATFKKLGENLITVYYNGNESSILEFFVTEPLETLIRKRAAFITRHEQHKDTTKWYDGLYSLYDMKQKQLLGPDHTDGFDYWWGYVLASDDPGLCKAPFVASKNVYLPDNDEISSLEYYLEHFVWGGLQRTDRESNPYGVHGVPNWHEARDSSLRVRSRDYNLDKMKIWRSYDYPHIFMLYYHMFQIAERYPEKVHYLNAQQYLERAAQTAKAYFTYPYQILPWYDTYKWGCYNELVLIPMIADLERFGKKDEAAWLRNEWEKKVKYFVYDDKYPFRSEYSIDRTAFESSYAFAKYGTLTKMTPDSNLWYDKNLKKWYSHARVDQQDSRAFMDKQLWAGLAVRGWLTPAYYALGSDDSEGGGLSYMARMGGWGILDYGLQFATHPADWLQLGYASYLSSFALINTGTAESNYGYWFPGAENDGATGWAFNSRKFGRIWLQDRSVARGAWPYDGEADLGNGAISRTAATIVTEDPDFGWIAYGGKLNHRGEDLEVYPSDGLNIRFAYIHDDNRIMVELSRDHISAVNPVLVTVDGSELRFHVENLTGAPHRLQFRLTGTPGSNYLLRSNGIDYGRHRLEGASAVVVSIDIPSKGAEIKLIK